MTIRSRIKLMTVALPAAAMLAGVAAYSLRLSTDPPPAEEMASQLELVAYAAGGGVVLSLILAVFLAKSGGKGEKDHKDAPENNDGRNSRDKKDAAPGRRPTLGNLPEVAEELIDKRVPALLAALHDPAAEMPRFAPIQVDSDEEPVQRVARALDAIQTEIASSTGNQAATIQAGVSELIVKLARRNQSLIDRQIDAIDVLESSEEDPTRLEQLFRLDHLATRMRRGAESLLILAGAEPPRRKGGPVAIADVLRVAMSEIEDYRRVQLNHVDDVKVGIQPAAELAHLLSELLDNATAFSPPETQVIVRGSHEADGYYLVTITDQGLGLSEEQMAEANAIMSKPPELTLSLSRSLGFSVIGRLARRHGVRVELMANPNRGTVAVVLIPATILVADHAQMMSAPGAQPIPPVIPQAQPGGSLPPQHAHPVAGAVPAGQPVAAYDDSADALTRLLGSAPPPDPRQMAPSADVHPFGMPTATPVSAPASEPTSPVDQGGSFDQSGLFEQSGLFDQGVSSGETPPVSRRPATPTPAVQPPGPVEPPRLDHVGAPTHPAPAVPPGIQFVPAGAAPPATLAQAIPEGERFDAGVASLLAPAPPSDNGGLTRRDPARSQAPVDEGRSVAPSVRSPEEIRQMLARYRDGKNRPTTAGPNPASPPDPFNPGGPQ